MKDNFTLQTYACTFLLRAVWSFAITCGAISGFSIIVGDATGNHYKLEKQNKQFEAAFFMLITIFELAATIGYICLWWKQRSLQDLTGLNKCDFQSTCCLLLFRMVCPIGLGVFVLVNMRRIEDQGDVYH